MTKKNASLCFVKDLYIFPGTDWNPLSQGGKHQREHNQTIKPYDLTRTFNQSDNVAAADRHTAAATFYF